MPVITTKHAEFEAKRRQVPFELILATVENPQQKVPSRKDRIIFQSKHHDRIEKKEMLLRIIVDATGKTFKVISVYKTSKIDKYWVRS